MANESVSLVLQQLRKLALLPSAGNLTDGELLRRFVGVHDEAAFNVLLQRHGPMVWALCQRVLRHMQDAEEAFQATFLALARQAASVRKQESLASWLYGVAYRLSRQVQLRSSRRPVPEARPADDPSQDPVRQFSLKELQLVLDEELQHLSEGCRMPLVLCFLEGKTRDEAAEALGWSVSTLKRRLEQGREILRARLTRRGLSLSVALFSAALAQDAAATAVPPALLARTLQAARLAATGQALGAFVPDPVIALVEGVCHAMMLTKLKIVTAVLLAVLVLGTGAGLGLRHALGQDGPAAPGNDRNQAQPDQKKDDKEAREELLRRELLQARAALRQAEAASRAAEAQARELAERARDAEQRARLEAERARALAEQLARKLQAERARAEDALAQAQAERLRAERALADARQQSDVERARAEAALAQAEAQRARAEKAIAEVRKDGDGPPKNVFVSYKLEGTTVRHFLLQDGRVYPGVVREGKFVIWHRAEPLLVSQYAYGGPQSRIPLIDARTNDYQTEAPPKGLERIMMQ